MLYAGKLIIPRDSKCRMHLQECQIPVLMSLRFECSTCKQTLIAITYKVKSAECAYLTNLLFNHASLQRRNLRWIAYAC